MTTRLPDDAPDQFALRRLDDALEHVDEGFQVLSRDWVYLYLNAAACKHGGQPRGQLLGRRIGEAFPGFEKTEGFARMQRCMEERRPDDFENEFETAGGERRTYELKLRPVPEGLAVFSIDVTEQRALASQLLHVQRMEALGRLAGGVAHDFNNLLTVIRAYGSLVHERLGADHEARSDMEQVLAAGERAEALVRQLLDFCRMRPIRPRELDVNEAVTSLDPIVRRLAGSGVELVTRLGSPMRDVCMDPTAFDQVVVNLVANARDAVRPGGRITIATGTVQLESALPMAKGVRAIPGPHVLMAISDDGSGMDARIKSRLFEPFFTTKEEGKGTGLGLSTCFGIVRQAGGYFAVESEPGRGSTFEVYLPASREREAA